MTLKEFARYLERDHGCLHCGATEALSPNHRANRGMGGSKLRDVPSNIIVLCSYMNGLIESNARMATLARSKGWKLETWQNPLETPVYDTQTKEWFCLNDQYGRKVVKQEREQ